MTVFEGTVLWQGTEKIVPNALVVFEHDADHTKNTHTRTNETGDFKIDLVGGPWKVQIFHEDGRPSESHSIEIPANASGTALHKKYELIAKSGDVDNKCGRNFFVGLIILIVFTFGGWAAAHILYPSPNSIDVASNLLKLSANARAVMDETEPIAENSKLSKYVGDMEDTLSAHSFDGELKRRANETTADIRILRTNFETPMDQLRAAFSALQRDRTQDESINDAISTDSLGALEQDIEAETEPHESDALTEVIEALESTRDGESYVRSDYIAKFKRAQVLSKARTTELFEMFEKDLDNLQRGLPALATAQAKQAPAGVGSFVWSDEPWIYLEILWWAFMGTLVRLIIIVQRYLRRGNFIRQGIYQHTAFLFTIPIMTLIFVVVISMAQLTTAESSIVLDLSDPRLVVGVSFLVALVPWTLWDRLSAIGRTTLSSGNDNG